MEMRSVRRVKTGKRLRVKNVIGIGMAGAILLFGCSVLGGMRQPGIADTASHLEQRISETESADMYFNSLSQLVYTISDNLSEDNNIRMFSTALSNLSDNAKVQIIYSQMDKLDDDDLESILYRGFENLDANHRGEYLLNCYKELDYSSKENLVKDEFSELERGQRVSVLKDCTIGLIGDYYNDFIERIRPGE